ncbi:MAG TPA: PPC domain-containing protein [Verrucomicrobiae bacterium]|nr:PPC domain-containing protein [Verrucomicrobiae bacterium]
MANILTRPGRLPAISLLIVYVSVRAEVPTLDYLFPAGGQRGTTNSLTIGGKFDPWPLKVWIDSPGLRFEPQTNKGSLKVIIEPEAKVGAHLVRIFNDDGASAPRWFVVGMERKISEIETNDSWTQAQRIEALPITINGRLEKSGDVDSFAVQLAAGKWMIATMDAYAIGSPIDPNLSLLDDHGMRVAFNSDSVQSLDPLLAYKVEKSGTYILQVNAFAHPPASEVRFAGSAASVYRLSVGQGPVARSFFPVSIRQGSQATINIEGWNVDPGSSEATWQVDSEQSAGVPFLPVPLSGGKLHLAINDLPHEAEREPNNSNADAQPLHWPGTIDGRIDPAGDEDRFRLSVKKNEKIEFRLRSASLGLPLDAFLRIDDSNGKQVARDDDSGEASDPLLNWTAPSNGTYIVVIADLFRRGGRDYGYALEMRAPVADFKVTVDSSAFRIEPGKTNEIKLAINRTAAHTNKLTATIGGLPEGVTAETAKIGAKDKEAKIRLIAAPEARPFSAPIQILITDLANRNLRRKAVFDLGAKEGRFGEMLINLTDQLWLTVTTNSPPPAEKPKPK